MAALRRASEAVDVPGTPRSLRLDHAELVVDRVRLRWSFVDPEEPYVRRIWTSDEAWQALLDHLTSHAAVHDEPSGIRVVRGTEQTVYRIDPADWAAYLTDPEEAATTDDGDLVPVGTPLSNGLPVWVIDELVEVNGSWEPAVVELVDGHLVGREA